MGKNKKYNLEEVSEVEEEKSPAPEDKPDVMQTVYTHGKVFKIPAKKDVKEFLREKWPNEKVE